MTEDRDDDPGEAGENGVAGALRLVPDNSDHSHHPTDDDDGDDGDDPDLSIPPYSEFAPALAEQHFVVSVAGKLRVYSKERVPGKQRWQWTVRSPSQFTALLGNQYCHWRKPGAPEEKLHKLGQAFLGDPSTRYYRGVVMTTAPVGDDWLNLWQGFAISPAPGDWGLFKQHLRQNVCRNDGELWRYLIGWMAWCVQHPTRPPGVALVLRGAKGVGKNVFAEHFGALFGQHYYLTDHPEQVMGRFSGHLRDCCLLVADEAFWNGNKRHEGVLKSMITSEQRGYEDKGLRAELGDNHLSVIILSNDSYVVPATEDERRFAMYDVGDAHRQDHAYFSAIAEQMRDGGSAAMLHDLLEMDLSGFNVRQAPKTKALFEQVLNNATPFVHWLMLCLADGVVYGAEGHVDWPTDRDLKAQRSSMYGAYVAWRKETGVPGRPESSLSFGQQLRKWASPPGNPGVITTRKMINYVTYHLYVLPPLDVARRYVTQHIGEDVDWASWVDEDRGDTS